MADIIGKVTVDGKDKNGKKIFDIKKFLSLIHI